jgi:hypothetical protein
MGYHIPVLRINFPHLSAREILLSLNYSKHDISVQYSPQNE